MVYYCNKNEASVDTWSDNKSTWGTLKAKTGATEGHMDRTRGTWVNNLNKQAGIQETLSQRWNIEKWNLGAGAMSCWCAPLVWHKGKSKAQDYPNRTKTLLFEKSLWHSEHMHNTHDWTWLIWTRCIISWKYQTINGVSQFGHLHYVARLTLGLALTKPAGSCTYDMTLFSFASINIHMSLGRCAGPEQRISHACTNLSSSIALSRSQNTTTWQSVSPTPSFTQPPT